MSFTHLHVSSAYSMHYGTAGVTALVEASKSYGARAAAITDRDGLYGAIKHIKACLSAGITPIVGVELLVDTGTGKPSSITLLAAGQNNGLGWATLARVISTAHNAGATSALKQKNKKQANWQQLSTDSTVRALSNRPVLPIGRLKTLVSTAEGVPALQLLLGIDSDVGIALNAGDFKLGQQLLHNWQTLLPGAVNIEVSCLFTEPGQLGSLPHAAQLLDLAAAARVPAVLSNKVRYLEPTEASTADVLESAELLLPLGQFQHAANAQAWLKPPTKMFKIAQMVVAASNQSSHFGQQLLVSTEELANKCSLDPITDIGWQQPKLPELSLLGLSTDANPQQILQQKCLAAIGYRYHNASEKTLSRVSTQLSYELATIESFGFASYFLTVADISSLITEMGVRNQARGSGAGSIVNYLLRISNVEPLEQELLFERFLGNKRSTLPDIDIDVESARRHEVYRAVFNKYGEHRVTLLSMQNKYRTRGAVRDAGRALGIPESVIDEIAAQIWRFPAREFHEQLTKKPELAKLVKLTAEDPKIFQLISVVEKMDRLPRHVAMHPCGVIVSNENLMSTTPVQPTSIGLYMSQFDKDDVDDIGLLKLDILGVRMQSSIAYAINQIKKIHGSNAARAGALTPDASYVKADGTIDIDNIPREDELTFEAIRTTNTIGMFQIESPGQRGLIGKLQPDCYQDLVADISLFRPGPMKGNLIAPFIAAKHKQEEPKYLHSSFRKFLSDSHGVVLYHEHIIKILATCMGIDYAQADELRRKLERTDSNVKAEFISASKRQLENGNRVFSDAEISEIWKLLEGFGSFGFCKAHGCAFALPTWQTAWLKTRYPTEFMAALFEHDPGMYPQSLLISEAKRMGVSLLPVHVNHSASSYFVVRQKEAEVGKPTQEGELAIRLSLREIPELTTAEVFRIENNQPYSSVQNFYQLVKPNERSMYRLYESGAFYQLPIFEGNSIVSAFSNSAKDGETAAQQLDGFQEIKRVISFEKHRQKRIRTRNTDSSHPELELDFSSYPAQRKLVTKLKELDPLEKYRDFLISLGVTPGQKIKQLANGSEVIVAGNRVATMTPPMKSGKRVVFITLDDGTGVIDTEFFEEAQQASPGVLFQNKLLVVAGRVRRTGERGVSVTAERAWGLSELYQLKTS